MDALLGLLLSFGKLPVAGMVCAFSGIARRKLPITFSPAARFVNVAILLLCFVIIHAATRINDRGERRNIA